MPGPSKDSSVSKDLQHPAVTKPDWCLVRELPLLKVDSLFHGVRYQMPQGIYSVNLKDIPERGRLCFKRPGLAQQKPWSHLDPPCNTKQLQILDCRTM